MKAITKQDLLDDVNYVFNTYQDGKKSTIKKLNQIINS